MVKCEILSWTEGKFQELKMDYDKIPSTEARQNQKVLESKFWALKLDSVESADIEVGPSQKTGH